MNPSEVRVSLSEVKSPVPVPEDPLSMLSVPAEQYQRICRKVPDPRCNAEAQRQCAEVNKLASPAKVCLFKSEVDEGALSDRGSI